MGGEPWPGVREAEGRLESEALVSRRAVEDVRGERSRLYDRWLAEQTRDAEQSEKLARAGAARASRGR
jgi:hypothetical protein